MMVVTFISTFDFILFIRTREKSGLCQYLNVKTANFCSSALISLFGEFNETGKPKISLAKYLVKFNDFAEPQRPRGKPILSLFDRLYTYLTACCMWKVC